MTPHGSVSTYTNWSCRCDECRAANAGWNRLARERRHRALMAGTVDVKHGKASTYFNYGCRCELCKKSRAAQYRAYRARMTAA